MTTREKGFFEKTSEEWMEAGQMINIKVSLEGLQKLMVLLVALSGLVIHFDLFGSQDRLNTAFRWLSWFFMVSWALAVIAIREEIVNKQNYEETKDLPYLD